MRILMVGGGCRGLQLTRRMAADGHAVRVVTRTEDRREEIEDAGGQCWIGDPDRIGTLRYALDNVTLLLWLLGTASGDPARVAALHDGRLEMMLERTTDSTVRGVIYESVGTVGIETLQKGVTQLERANRVNEIPYALLTADPRDEAAWQSAMDTAIAGLLGPR